MPLYEYECDACSRRFEVIQKFSEQTDTCRVCGKGPVRRLQSSPAIQFKGTGWYITDYAQKGKTSGDSAGAEKGEKGEKGDTKAGTDKGEAKPAASDAKAGEKSTSDATRTAAPAAKP